MHGEMDYLSFVQKKPKVNSGNHMRFLPYLVPDAPIYDQAFSSRNYPSITKPRVHQDTQEAVTFWLKHSKSIGATNDRIICDFLVSINDETFLRKELAYKVVKVHQENNTGITSTDKEIKALTLAVKSSIDRALECNFMEEVRVGNTSNRNYGKNKKFFE